MSQPVARAPVPRVGARMLVIDPDDRVLLIEEAGNDPAVGAWHHWLTPGGGVERGEALTDAATREVIEETGLRIELPREAVPVHRQRRTWGWAGVTYDQVDHIFAARVGEAFHSAPVALTDMERQTVAGARWWTLEEIRASEEVLIPPDLADVLERALVAPLTRPVTRSAGRVLVIDPDDRVLLIETVTSPGEATTHWIAPGGGIEPGETAAGAAGRELAEETGIVAAVEAPAGAAGRSAVHVERAVFVFNGQGYDQTDFYFVVHLDHVPKIDRSGLTDLERRVTVEYRWWRVDELRATTERYWPAELVSVLDRVTGSRA